MVVPLAVFRTRVGNTVITDADSKGVFRLSRQQVLATLLTVVNTYWQQCVPCFILNTHRSDHIIYHFSVNFIAIESCSFLHYILQYLCYHRQISFFFQKIDLIYFKLNFFYQFWKNIGFFK